MFIRPFLLVFINTTCYQNMLPFFRYPVLSKYLIIFWNHLQGIEKENCNFCPLGVRSGDIGRSHFYWITWQAVSQNVNTNSRIFIFASICYIVHK